MTSPIPKWIQIRYSILWKKFKNDEFTYEQAEIILGNLKGINVFFSDLRKAGWVNVNLDQKDSRKRIFRLREPNLVFNELI